MENIIWQIIIGLFLAIIGFGVWRLQNKITENEKSRETKENNRETFQINMMKCICATILLGEATALAVRDSRTNGEMTEALKYARIVKKESEEFLVKQGITKII